MIRVFHRLLGWTLLVAFLYWLFHRSALLPGSTVPSTTAHLASAHGSALGFSRSAGGHALACVALTAAIICFLWPERLMSNLSPRIEPDYDYLLTEGVWYAVGYSLLLLSLCALMVVRQG